MVLVAAGEVVAGVVVPLAARRAVRVRECLREAVFASGSPRRAREIATCAPDWATTRTRG